MDPGKFALKSACRAAIVVPLAFALSLVVIDIKQMALFAAFGSMALLVFVDFGGPPRARLRAYLLLSAGGGALIALGTLCSRSTVLATLAMGVVAFAILFAGVLGDYLAAASSAAMLSFVLAVMVPADLAAIPTRLAGWALAAALCIPAALLLWPGRPRSAVRRDAAQAARSLARLADARAAEDRPAADTATTAAREATVAVRGRFFSMALRPSGVAGPTAALARLIEDLSWLNRIAAHVPARTNPDVPCRGERLEIEAAVPVALRSVADRLEGISSDAPSCLRRLEQANHAFGRALLERFERLPAGRDEATATAELDDAFRLRQAAFAVLQAGRDALEACGERPGGAQSRTTWMRLRMSRRVAETQATMSSVWLRNSLRGAVGLALAVLVGQLSDLNHAFWIVLGTMSVLRSDAFSTGRTIWRALLGTLLGILAGGLVVAAVGAEEGLLWAVLPFAVLLAAYASRQISFVAGQAAFTLVVLVLFDLIEPAGWKVGLVRVEDVALGASVSLLVGILIWPRGASAVLRRAVGGAYVGAARHLDATIDGLLGDEQQASPELAAQEAFQTAQLLDATVRDYLSGRGSRRGGLDELTVLVSGAGRVRRVARLLAAAPSFGRLAPIGDELPRLARARDAFESERHALCGWYSSFGTAISHATPSPSPTTRPAASQELAPPARVVLERPAKEGGLPPGLAIAWAYRHLDALAEFEPTLVSAWGSIVEGPPA